jgi:hypothetical protein
MNRPHLRRLLSLHSIGSFDEPGPICEGLETSVTPENSFFKDSDFFKAKPRNILSGRFIEDDLVFSQIIDAKLTNKNEVSIERNEEKKTKKIVKKKSFLVKKMSVVILSKHN